MRLFKNDNGYYTAVQYSREIHRVRMLVRYHYTKDSRSVMAVID